MLFYDYIVSYKIYHLVIALLSLSNTGGSTMTTTTTITKPPRFVTLDEGTTSVPNMMIGCGHENKFAFPPSGYSGVLGLGPHHLSLWSHLSSNCNFISTVTQF
ncbi:hypothetical protein HYC85_003776 [Camellia sinensis]|uniref:Xylanase inhibitor N-terminal domain-containing protein n=1 Tax=Camellia sinensis TaxID=4442 RepID=A0A7J7HWC9_CAMSI|nr:hypothetical protein HYC85_003776 [Camellia sinensis]